jgi:hypothetical protein
MKNKLTISNLTKKEGKRKESLEAGARAMSTVTLV